MKKLFLPVLLLALGTATWGQVPLAPAVGPAEVLAFLQSMPIPTELKLDLTGEMTAAMAEGRLTPGVALPFLQECASLPPEQTEEVLLIVLHALAGEFIVDPLLNEALKGIRLSRPWPEVTGILRLRLALLEATRDVLTGQRLVPESPPPGYRSTVPTPSPSAKVILETAWAIGDFLIAGGNPADGAGMEALVRMRLTRLSGSVLPSQVVNPLLAVLSPALMQEITRLALNPERR